MSREDVEKDVFRDGRASLEIEDNRFQLFSKQCWGRVASAVKMLFLETGCVETFYIN